MKTISPFLLFAAVAFAAVDPLRGPFAELKLKDGRVLKNVQIVSFATSSVMAKWDGGRGTIRIDQLPEAILSALPKPQRTVAPAASPLPPFLEKPIPISKDTPLRTITGQMFESDQRGSSYKYTDSLVKAYPLERLDEFKRHQKSGYRKPTDLAGSEDLAARVAMDAALSALKLIPIAETNTDGEGRFQLQVPKDVPVFLHARGVRRYQELMLLRLWIVEVRSDAMNLSGDNRWEQWREDPSLRP